MVMAEWAQIFVSEYEYLEVNKESHILRFTTFSYHYK